MKKIYIDCSHAYFIGGNSGIQRVVRNIAKNSQELYSEANLAVWTGKHYYSIKKLNFQKKSNSARVFHILILILKKIFNHAIASLQKDTIYSKNKYPLRELFIDLYYKVISIQFMLKRPINFKKNDVLLLADSIWNVKNNFWNYINNLRSNGVRVGTLLYDLIPISHPLFFNDDLVRMFNKYIDNTLIHADFIIAISKTVAIEVKNRSNSNIKISDFRLGHTLDNYDKKAVSSKVKSIFLKVKPYTMVATIEPRKNHLYTLDAFEIIWKQGSNEKLCIVGAVGWLCDDIIKRIKNHREFNKKLFMLNKVNDTELEFIYGNSKALITPAIIEGFNLPIVEALQRKLPVYASDIPVHREVGGKYCHYFDLSSPASLANMLINPPQPIPLNDYYWPDWKESTKELFEKIENCTNK